MKSKSIQDKCTNTPDCLPPFACVEQPNPNSREENLECSPNCKHEECFKKMFLESKPKTEDTGECGCECHCDANDYCAEMNHSEAPCVHCKASGVSKEASTKDSCDTLSSSENKEESMEDRFKKKGFERQRGINSTYTDNVIDFIQSEISKAVAKERESIKRQIKKDLKDLSYSQKYYCGYKFSELLSLLNSKKGHNG